jgi:hypothetical protein
MLTPPTLSNSQVHSFASGVRVPMLPDGGIAERRPAMPSLLLCCVGRRPKSFSKQHERLENGRTERRPCHTAVTIRCGLGELTGDGLIRFPVVRTGRGSLRHSQIQPMSDWGQVVAGSNPVSPKGFEAGQQRFRKIWDRLSSGKKWLCTPTRTPTSPRLGPFRDRRSLPEHGADRAVPLGPHLDRLGPLLGQPHEQRHAGRHAVQFGVVLAAALELFA